MLTVFVMHTCMLSFTEFDETNTKTTSSDVTFSEQRDTVPFTTFDNITLAIEGKVSSSVDETVETTWYFNGGTLPPDTKLGVLRRPLLSLSQTLDIEKANIFDDGFYEVSLSIDPYKHLISHYGCPREYYTFIVDTVGISKISLDQAVIQLKYYGKINTYIDL